MANKYLPNGIQALRKKNGRDAEMSSELYYVETPAAGITVGSFVSYVLDTGVKTYHTDDTVIVDSTSEADTAASSGAKICGLVGAIYDNDGKLKRIQKISTTETGRVQVYPVEDTIFGAATAAAMELTGRCKLNHGTMQNYDPDTTMDDHPQPFRNDTLDTQHASTAHAFNLLGAYGSMRNRDTTAAQYAQFEVNATFIY